jgi:hypothetical protein
MVLDVVLLVLMTEMEILLADSALLPHKKLILIRVILNRMLRKLLSTCETLMSRESCLIWLVSTLYVWHNWCHNGLYR